jgi:hypothetical protein
MNVISQRRIDAVLEHIISLCETMLDSFYIGNVLL